jgi:hypothetical protein
MYRKCWRLWRSMAVVKTHQDQKGNKKTIYLAHLLCSQKNVCLFSKMVVGGPLLEKNIDFQKGPNYYPFARFESSMDATVFRKDLEIILSMHARVTVF